MNFYYDGKGNLYIGNKKASKRERKFYRLWGYVVCLIFLMIGILIGRWLF